MKIKYPFLFCCLLITVSAGAQVKNRSADIDDSDTERVYTVFDEAPYASYNFSKYLAENIHYPDSAIVHNIEGRVVIKFVVKKNGKISRCEVSKSVNDYLDAEALRVVCDMPAWNPGKVGGRKVKVWFQQPVMFKLAD